MSNTMPPYMPIKAQLWAIVTSTPGVERGNDQRTHVVSSTTHDNADDVVVTFGLANANMKLAVGSLRNDAKLVDGSLRLGTYSWQDLVLCHPNEVGMPIILNDMSMMPRMVDLTTSSEDNWPPMSETQRQVACRIIEQAVLAPAGIVPLENNNQLATVVMEYIASLGHPGDYQPADNSVVFVDDVRHRCAALMRLVAPDLVQYTHRLPPLLTNHTMAVMSTSTRLC
jgi:hypothetical protein